MALAKLTDKAVRNAKPGPRPRKLSDGAGLYLLVAPRGGKYWRFKYRIGGKEKTLALGVYPDVTLAAARARLQEAREAVAGGVDPALVRKSRRESRGANAENSFEAVAREWFESRRSLWAPAHAERLISRLERDLFPWLSARPIGEITPPELLRTVRRIEARGALETAHRALQTTGQIFRYAIATGRAERDTAADLRGALAPWKGGHFAAITDPAELGGLLRAIDGYRGSFIVRCALKLAPLLFVRPGELRRAEWDEMDLKHGEWSIPGEKTKTSEPHLVPLARQAQAIITEIMPLTSRGRYVFPGMRSRARPVSDMALSAALKRMGYSGEEMSIHGFRATARTLLDEVLGFRPDFIEHQLGHAVRDPLGRAYNRTQHLDERRKMMQAWADYLDSLRGQVR